MKRSAPQRHHRIVCSSTPDDDFNQLLRLQSEDVAEEIRRSESLGDGRVNLFLTLVGVSLAALAAAGSSSDLDVDRNFLFVAVFGFVALLLVGWCTFLRILQRNVRTDEAIEDQAYLIRFLAARCGANEKMRRALAFKPYRWGNEMFPRKSRYENLEMARCDDVKYKDGPNPLESGGLAETMVLLNSIISFVLFMLLGALELVWITHSKLSVTLEAMPDWHWLVVTTGGISVGFLSALSQRHYALMYYEKEEKKRWSERNCKRNEEYDWIKSYEMRRSLDKR